MRSYGCSGHIDLRRIPDFSERTVREKIRAHFSEGGDGVLYCGMADGADEIFRQEAVRCGIKISAVLPKPKEEFALEHADKDAFFQALAQADRLIECDGYKSCTDYIVAECDELLLLWDGVRTPLEADDGTPINVGGTYYALTVARASEKPITLF
ncbi:MAG: hypothetical protein IJ735_01450 [Clostridia bacterium]|nr:hypothetical protein [Clostridia bacterium]